MAGNLLVFRGPDAINAYAHFLKRSAALLWAVRGLLLVSVILHVHSAWSLTRAARAARPEGYRDPDRRAGTWSGRTMRWGGVFILLFVVYHLLHLTTGTVHPAFDPENVYGNVVAAFGVPAVAGFYVAAMVALALHLHHGVWSLFQTLGANHPHLNPGRRRLATFLAVAVPLGFAAIPVAVLLGFLS
jgi:succinate dehydrogenase / fumarate reductase cytochrome b subunit